MAKTVQEIVRGEREILHRRIDHLVKLASLAATPELLHACYCFHLLRLLALHPDMGADIGSPQMMRQFTAVTEEAQKHLIQVLTAIAKLGVLPWPTCIVKLNQHLYAEMVDLAIRANTLDEKLGMIELLEKYAYVEGDKIAVAMSNAKHDEYFDYSARIEEVNLHMVRVLRSEDYLKRFEAEYKPYGHLLEKATGYSFDAHLKTFTCLFEEIKKRIDTIPFPEIGPGYVPPLHPATVMEYSNALIFSEPDIRRRLGDEALAILKAWSFDASRFDPHNQRFHQLDRTPIIQLKNRQMLIVPELILDALRWNTHYSILEQDNRTKGEYTALASDAFVDEIGRQFSEHGYREVLRDVMLRDGRENLGDIDLIVENDVEVILVEAKNHSLPLDVYFSVPQAMRNRRFELRETWLRKVERRLEAVKTGMAGYRTVKPFHYLLISKLPELISYDTAEILCLGFEEFKEWVARYRDKFAFADVRAAMMADREELTERDLGIFRDAKLYPFSFSK